MNMEVPKEKSQGESPAESVQDASEQEEHPSLRDEALQEAYRKAYLEQLRRRSCPGCGETEIS